MALSFKIWRGFTASPISSLLKSLINCPASKCSEHMRAVFTLTGSFRRHRDSQILTNLSSLGNLWYDRPFAASVRHVFLQVAAGQLPGILDYSFNVSTMFYKHTCYTKIISSLNAIRNGKIQTEALTMSEAAVKM